MQNIIKSTAILLLCSLICGIHSLKSSLKIEASKVDTKNLTTTNSTSSTSTPSPLTTRSPTMEDILTTAAPTPTTKSTVTQTIVIPTTKVPDKMKNRTKLKAVSVTKPNDYFCDCDLSWKECNINCCCDLDCGSDALKVFQCNGKSDDQDYNIESGLALCDISGGWLCIAKDNSKINKKEIFNIELKKTVRYTWPNPFVNSQNINATEFYVVGNPILLYNDVTEELHTIDLPFSLINHYCQVFEPVRHLEPFTRDCLLSSTKAQDFYSSLLTTLSTSSILKYPKSMEQTEIMTMKNSRSETDCLKVDIFRCDDFNSCRIWLNATLETDAEYFCNIKIELYHNFTNIARVRVYFYEERTFTWDADAWHHFTVTFVDVQKYDGAIMVYSGPLGYDFKKPVIVGKPFLVNETKEGSDKNLVLNYFHPNSTVFGKGSYIQVPQSEQGSCSLGGDVVNFGEESYAQCDLKVNITNISEHSNITEICKDLQERAFMILIGSDHVNPQLRIYVSEFGLPRNKTESWTRLQLLNFESRDILSTYDQYSQTFSCRNLINAVTYEFLVARIQVDGIDSQNVIKSASLKLDAFVDLSFSAGEEILFPLSFTVMFHDLTDSVSSAPSRLYFKVILRFFHILALILIIIG